MFEARVLIVCLAHDAGVPMNGQSVPGCRHHELGQYSGHVHLFKRFLELTLGRVVNYLSSIVLCFAEVRIYCHLSTSLSRSDFLGNRLYDSTKRLSCLVNIHHHVPFDVSGEI